MYQGRNFGCNFGVGATSGPVWRPIRTFHDNRMAGNRAKKYQCNLALQPTKTARKSHGVRLMGVHVIGKHLMGVYLVGVHLTGGRLTGGSRAAHGRASHGMYPRGLRPRACVLWADIS